MKIPTDNIFQLIHTMTASEKRYFKRHYASEKSHSTDLFDFLNKLDHYNEEAVKKHFANTKVTSNLKVYKVQLADLILKSLVSYHNKKSIRSKIRMGLEEVEILMNKQLYVLASNRLKKIKKICLQHEELEYIFSIMYFEILLQSFFHVNLNPSEYPMLEEVNEFADTLKNIYRLKKVNFSLNDIINNELTQSTSKEQRQFYRSFFKTEAKSAENQNLSLNERYYLNSALSMIQKTIFNNPEKEYQYKKKNIVLFESDPERITNHKDFYFAACFNYLSCCRRLGRFKEMEEGIAQIKTLVKEFPFLEKNLNFVYYLELKYYFQTQQFNYIKTELESVVSEHISKFQQKGEHLTALCFLYFVLNNLVLDDHQKVQFYFRRLHTLAKSLDQNYQQFFILFELICHFESNNLFAISNLIKSTQRKLKKQHPHSIFFPKFIAFLQNFINEAPIKQVEMAQQFKEQLKDDEGDGVLNLAKEFILEDWLTALANQRKYAKELTLKSKSNQ